MLGGLRQATKAMASAVVATGLLALAQHVALELGADRTWVVLLPILTLPVIAFVYTEVVVRYRVGALSDAFMKISEGALDTELPPAPDADIAATREAFVRMSAALRQMTEELRQVDARRRKLFADLAHELGTPTATVVALADALALPAIEASPEKRAELVDALVGEGLRLSRLVSDLRDLAELDDPSVALHRTSSDVAQLVTAVARRLSLARPDAAPIDAVVPESAIAEVDEHRIEQVLVNVLVNAQRHSPRDRPIELRLDEAGASIRITVEDHGCGVDDEHLAHLGERLFRADPSRSRSTGGSGLGLSIVRMIVERHEGTLRFARAEGGGLRVIVDLPREADLASRPEA